jgi:hypothetical protein
MPLDGVIDMASGGARNRSGPPPVEGSRTSERKGFSLTALPREGYAGEVPDLLDFLPDATARQVTIWKQLWSTPQARAWFEQAWRWPIIADLAMWMDRAQAPDAAASIATTIRQLRDDCALSTAGMTQAGWKIADAPTPAPDTDAPRANVTNIKSRLSNGGA